MPKKPKSVTVHYFATYDEATRHNLETQVDEPETVNTPAQLTDLLIMRGRYYLAYHDENGNWFERPGSMNQAQKHLEA